MSWLDPLASDDGSTTTCGSPVLGYCYCCTPKLNLYCYSCVAFVRLCLLYWMCEGPLNDVEEGFCACYCCCPTTPVNVFCN